MPPSIYSTNNQERGRIAPSSFLIKAAKKNKNKNKKQPRRGSERQLFRTCARPAPGAVFSSAVMTGLRKHRDPGIHLTKSHDQKKWVLVHAKVNWRHGAWPAAHLDSDLHPANQLQWWPWSHGLGEPSTEP